MSSTPSRVAARRLDLGLGPDLRAALVAMVRRRVPESEVEDIVQATLTDAFESAHAPEDPETFRRWIFGVAKNKVVDYHRRAGRETFEVPEVPERPAPHTEADLLRWAERHLPPGEENRTTLDWMLREGDGEKLEWIAESEKVPAPRVRQRVSRLRRHLKTHWQREVSLLAALGVLVTAALLFLRHREPEPIANEDVLRGIELRNEGLEKCAAGDWKPCLEKLDAAKALDPAGDTQPAVQTARDNANKALTAPPPPSAVPSVTAPPASPTASNNTTPPPSPKDIPTETVAKEQRTPRPMSTEFTPVPTSSSFPVDSGSKLRPKTGPMKNIGPVGKPRPGLTKTKAPSTSSLDLDPLSSDLGTTKGAK
jgi:DNA-directed RNA polymerase specialized sigma24 family protein